VVVCVECLRAGAQLAEPKLTQRQLLVIAGNCRDEHHTHLPEPPAPAVAVARTPLDATRLGSVVRALFVAGAIALAGGTAYGMVGGELGHHGAALVDAPTTHARTPAEVLGDAYRTAQGSVGTAASANANANVGTDAGVVYVDGDTDSDGPSIVSEAFPSAGVSVLAVRGVDGSCTFLHGSKRGSSIATTPPGSACHASAAPRTGWSPDLREHAGQHS
jgi:hypothetical protein